LHLNDPALVFEPEAHEALGRGFRCGFLGVLHSEIISERVQREFGVSLIISRPSVEFRITDNIGKELSVKTAAEWPAFAKATAGGPASQRIQQATEPWVTMQLITPQTFLSRVLSLLSHLEGKHVETRTLSQDMLLLVYEIPLREIIIDFYDKLKSVTQGMASMDYEMADFRPADLVKLEVLVAGEKEDAFSQIVPRSKAYSEGKKLVEKLKLLLPQQLFAVPLQTVVEGKILARETIKATRRDVTAPLYGGDVTRKRKLLEKQKKGKKELKEKGRIRIPPKVFLDVFRG